MTWVFIAIGIFAVIGLALAWTESAEWRSLRRRSKRLSPRQARRAKAHYLDQQEEAELMGRANREAATLKGVRSMSGYGLAAASGIDGGGDAGDGGNSD